MQNATRFALNRRKKMNHAPATAPAPAPAPRPVWVDATVKDIFSNYILGKRDFPKLWHPELVPLPRLFLIYGVKKNNMTKGVVQQCQEHGVSFRVAIFENNPSVASDTLAKAEAERGEVIILHNVQHLSSVRRASNLESVLGGFQFIICTSEECPGPEEDFFWGQFLPEHRYLKEVPSKDFRIQLFDWWLTAWGAHWGTPAVFDAETLKLLALCADYCTPHDVKVFMQRVFRGIIQQGEGTVLTYDFMRKYMYALLKDMEDVKCIVNHDAAVLFGTYAVTKHQNKEEGPVRKRLKE
jgi:hypothetical protein